MDLKCKDCLEYNPKNNYVGFCEIKNKMIRAGSKICNDFKGDSKVYAQEIKNIDPNTNSRRIAKIIINNGVKEYIYED